jgi:hypothetical protein
LPFWPGRPKIAQNYNTSKTASGRPRIGPRQPRCPNGPPKRPQISPLNRRHIKVNCDMMIVQKTLKSTCKAHIFDIQNIVFRPFQRRRIDQIVSMSQRSLKTAPKNRFGALLEPLGPIYNRNLAHLGPQEQPNIGLRRSEMLSWGRLGSVLVPFGAFWGVLGAVLCPCLRINCFSGSRWPTCRPQITPKSTQACPSSDTNL